MIAILSSLTLLYLSSCGFSWKDCRPVFTGTENQSCLALQWFVILSFSTLICLLLQGFAIPSSLILNCHPVSACNNLPSSLLLYWTAILSLPAVICHPVFSSTKLCHPVFSSTELLSCLCLQWFAILSSPPLNCYPVSVCSDLPPCHPLYWIAILSLPAVICHPVFPSIELLSCLCLQWFATLSSPAVYKIHPVNHCSDLLSCLLLTDLSITDYLFILVINLSLPQLVFLSCLTTFLSPYIQRLLVSLACPGSHVSCVFLYTLHSPWIGRKWI